MTDALTALSSSDRRVVENMAIDAGVAPECLVPAIISAYVRLLLDAPAALPSNHLGAIKSGAKKFDRSVSLSRGTPGHVSK